MGMTRLREIDGYNKTGRDEYKTGRDRWIWHDREIAGYDKSVIDWCDEAERDSGIWQNWDSYI